MSTMRYYKERIRGSIFFYSMLLLLLERSQSSTNPETERRTSLTLERPHAIEKEANVGQGTYPRTFTNVLIQRDIPFYVRNEMDSTARTCGTRQEARSG